MSSSSRRGSKISNIQQVLSKYDAKYVKTSALVLEDSSDDMKDEDVSKSEQSESRGIFKTQNSSSHSHTYDNIRKYQGKPEDPGSLVGTSLSPTLKRSSNVDATDESDSKSSTILEDNAVLKTASSMDSVKTDSSAGFNNIHSISSLADSVLPLYDVQDNTLPTFVMSNPPIMASPALSSTAQSSARDSSLVVEENEENNPVTTCTDKPVVLSSSSPVKMKNYLNTDAKPGNGDDCHVSETSGEINESQLIRIRGKISSKSSTPNLSRHQSQNACLQNLQCPLHHPGRKTVAVQTSHFSTYCADTNKRQAQTRAEIIPVLKSTKLPSFLKHDTDSTINIPACSCQKKRHSETMTTLLDKEVSELVSQHLHLVKEFLERQHRMYLANCRAVQLLEHGFQQND